VVFENSSNLPQAIIEGTGLIGRLDYSTKLDHVAELVGCSQTAFASMLTRDTLRLKRNLLLNVDQLDHLSVIIVQ